MILLFIPAKSESSRIVLFYTYAPAVDFAELRFFGLFFW